MLCVMNQYPPYEPPEKFPWQQTMRPPVRRRNWFLRHPWTSAFAFTLLILSLSGVLVIGVLER